MPLHLITPEESDLEALIQQHLKDYGEQLDTEIAQALKLPFEQVRTVVQELAAKGKVMACFVTRYRNGEKIEGWSCRPSGFIPQAAPGPKPGRPKS